MAGTDPVAIVAQALAGATAWVVGGAVRDELRGRPVVDVDVALVGDVGRAARDLARAIGGPRFALSVDHGAWRVLAPDGSWYCDLNPLRGTTIEEDLAVRDLTVNAMARPLSSGSLIDPHDGVGDLNAEIARAVGPRAFVEDPLRVVRLARVATELGLTVEPATAALARVSAPDAADVAQERVFSELARLLSGDTPVAGVRALQALALLPAILPEVDALRGVEQSSYHHLDVFEHTLAVIEGAAALRRDPSPTFATAGIGLGAVLAEPLADDLERGTALIFGALFHDIAKPQTRATFPDGRIGFPAHDREGAMLARTILTRLRASEKLRAHVAELTRHHLRLGFLVANAPLDRGQRFDYFRACGSVAVDVTALSVADRLATRGRNAEPAIAKHVALAVDVLDDALSWHAGGPPSPLWRGDELATALGRTPGPWLGELLMLMARAQYCGEFATRTQALAWARSQPGSSAPDLS